MEEAYLKDVIKIFQYYRNLGKMALEQVDEKDLFYAPDPECNSLAVIVNHLSGNMLSRWTDFLTSDGEKEWRDRDREFEPVLNSRKLVMDRWNTGWDCLFDSLNQLIPDDMMRTIYIRNTGHSVSEAINRQLAHYPYHVGQIVFLAKQFKQQDWKCLSIPRGGSGDFNRTRFEGDSSKRHFTDDLK